VRPPMPPPPTSPLFPYPTLFRSLLEPTQRLPPQTNLPCSRRERTRGQAQQSGFAYSIWAKQRDAFAIRDGGINGVGKTTLLRLRSEEHTSELQSLTNLVCRLVLL